MAEAPNAAPAKKVRPPPPPPPAAVATAAAVLRGALAGVLGLPIGRTCSDLQPTWNSEPGTGKFTMDLAKAVVPMPEDIEAQKILLGRVAAVANDFIKKDLPVVGFQMAAAEAESTFGEAMYDADFKGAGDTLSLVSIDGLCLMVNRSAGPLCASTGSVGSVEVVWVHPKKDTAVIKGKLGLKFKVGSPDAAGSILEGGSAPAAASVAALNTFETTVAGGAEALAAVKDAAKSAEEDSAAAAAAAKAKVQALKEKVAALEAASAKAAAEVEEAKAQLKTAADEAGGCEDDGEVNPWEVTGTVDYAKLIDKFGSSALDETLLKRMEALTVGRGRVSALHRFLRRGIFFSHRDMERICEEVEKGRPFFLYTGRGPSSESMHLGHLIPFLMTKWLQDAFGVPLVIQMTDDEKFLWKGHYEDEKGDNLMDFRRLTTENAKDIIACGFDKSKTFIFSDLDYMGHMYPNIVRIQKAVTYSTARSMFGFVGESNIGQSAFPAVQAAPSFASSFRVCFNDDNKLGCLIPCAIDQDPYFRMTRDVAHKLVPKDHPLKGKPALLHSKFFPPLQGSQGKMSASNTNSAIFLTDSDETIREKITHHAFSGGQDTKKKQEELGADLAVDVSYQWLRFFLEDDAELEQIGAEYGKGQGKYGSTGAVKGRLIELLQELVREHATKRRLVTEEEVAEWMVPRPLKF